MARVGVRICVSDRARRAAFGTALLAAIVLTGSGGAMAEPQRPVSLEPGRWSGRLFDPAASLSSAPPGALHNRNQSITLDITPCGDRLCGRLVSAEGCGAIVLDLAANVGAPDRLHPTHKGEIRLPERPAVAVSGHAIAPANGAGARLEIRTGNAPLYARRMTLDLTVSLERTGPATCEPRPTS